MIFDLDLWWEKEEGFLGQATVNEIIIVVILHPSPSRSLSPSWWWSDRKQGLLGRAPRSLVVPGGVQRNTLCWSKQGWGLGQCTAGFFDMKVPSRPQSVINKSWMSWMKEPTQLRKFMIMLELPLFNSNRQKLSSLSMGQFFYKKKLSFAIWTKETSCGSSSRDLSAPRFLTSLN